MHKIDPPTLTFYRFFIAFLCLLPYLLLTGDIAPLAKLRRWRLTRKILFTGAMMALNYGFYIFALARMSPSGAQVLIQLAPMMFLLAGVFIFDEYFSMRQWLGFAVFVVGLFTFFHLRISAMLAGFDNYAIGMLLMLAAALFWVIYAIGQKQLLSSLGSIHLMMLINGIGTVAFLPFASPLQVTGLNAFELVLLFLCGLNTVIAYGAFTEALKHWQASRISATLAIVPLLTLGFVQLNDYFDFIPLISEPLDAWVLLGAALVVIGAFTASMANYRRAG